MEPEDRSLARAASEGTVLEVVGLLQQGASPLSGFPLALAAGVGRLEVCAILLDAGADPGLRTSQDMTARDLAQASGHLSVANFLGVVSKMLAEGHELSPGHSYLEIARIVRSKEDRGESCPRCGVRVPAPASQDHIYSHAWEIQVKQGRAAGRPAAPERVDAHPGVIPAGKVAVFSGLMGDLAVTATDLEITGLGITGNTDIVPLDTIQSISVSGFFWKHLDIHTSGYVHQWESGLNARKAEQVRRLILDAREALLARRRA
jgi:hypothetical protein